MPAPPDPGIAAVDLDTGAVVAAELHPADEGDTTTLPKTLAAAEANWTLLTKVETSCDRILIAGGANVEAEWEQGPAV